jgi:hypothetical protein
MGVSDAARKSNQPARWVGGPACHARLQAFLHTQVVPAAMASCWPLQAFKRLYAPAMVADALLHVTRTTERCPAALALLTLCQPVGNFAVRASLYETLR